MYWTMGLVLAVSAGASRPARVLAQTTTLDPLHCGPGGVKPGDLVALNIGNVGQPPQTPVVLHARVLDEEGVALSDQILTLAPGQSLSVSVRVDGGLVRGEVEPVSGPENAGLIATMQVTRQLRLRLTDQQIFLCAGLPGSRPPA
jgi:hypothetical protein